ncbi:enoyl-CoA hydratase/isomerase family protein [Variovorax sp. J22P271]|uniref:enoyl-CoA hydratase/isomerase family protein n=1 Tax=Variovorax davisae TaxID=3053515 RepID=UPI002577F275|nr:enoyl-CoA hydratase/isomerase family protein [Variovorax sp. J22P271]MDM0032016.1 enoyl-CoA hydratase/isomerase family protein [Variovorax sp. J22P271]
MTTSSLYIDLRTEDGIAILSLNRPDVRNAINDDMRGDLMAALDQVNRDDAVRALVLTGAGKAFCAGGDIRAMQRRMQAPASEVAYNGWARQQRTHHVLTALHNLPKPTIAAVNGASTGLGTDLAMACDFVVASEAHASFAWNYVLRGLIPDGGGMYFLPRRVGLAKAKELIFTGRTVRTAEAVDLGIADRASTPEALVADAVGWARELSAGSRTALALGKTILNQSFELQAEQVFGMGSQAQAICYASSEHHTAVNAFLAKSAAKE